MTATNPFEELVQNAGAAIAAELAGSYPGAWWEVYAGQENAAMLHAVQARRIPGVYVQLLHTQKSDNPDISVHLRPRMVLIHLLVCAGGIANRSSVLVAQDIAWKLEQKVESDPMFNFGTEWIQPGTLAVAETMIEEQTASGTIYSVAIEALAYFGLFNTPPAQGETP